MSSIKDLIEEHLSSSAHLSKKHVHPRLAKMFDMAGLSVAFTRSEGPYLWDREDNRYLDLLSGGGVHFIGRHHPEVQEALKAVVDMDIPNLCVVNASVLGGLVAEKLLEMAGPGFSKVQYSNSGAEANEVAIRFSRFCTRKRRFLHLQGAFHGRTYGAISMCGFRQMNDGMDPKMPTCTMITPNDLQELRYELEKGDVAGIFYEYCQGMTLTVLEREYMHEMRRLCTEYGALMIADEVQTGLARMGGEWFAFQKAGVMPDMVSISKTLSGGEVPVAATLISDSVYNTVFSDFKAGPIYFSTFAENNLSMAASLATLNVLTDIDARRLATELSDKLRAGLADIQSRYDVIERVAGEGLMIGIYFRDSESKGLLKLQQQIMKTADPGAFGAAVNVEMLAKHNVIVQLPGPELNAIKILPAVTLSDEGVVQFLEAFEATMASMYKSGGPALSLGKAALKDALRGAKDKIVSVRQATFGSSQPGFGRQGAAAKK
jgi:ornithine--oxo-acid transaminase